MKNLIFQVIGILGFAVTFVPAYFGEELLGDCIDPIEWEIAHTHPEMLTYLLCFIGAFPCILLGVKHGLLADKEMPSWPKSIAWTMFWVTPGLVAYADTLSIGCPYSVDLQNYLLRAAFILMLSSLLLGLCISHKEKAARKNNF
ncbi:MAG: hypothetical protein J6N49_06015 [Alphaproteobacteria bacterium]|nr:hypothetical protein [Alphaproteobacteria bacterium]